VLTVKLGIATKRDLAQLCAEVYSPQASTFLWITAEIAIAACDLAEVIGSAIALQLLFGLPLVWGEWVTEGGREGFSE
jgi:manganese transport protein